MEAKGDLTDSVSSAAAYAYTDALQYSGWLASNLRELFGDDLKIPEIRSTTGAILVLSFVLYPYVYIMARTDDVINVAGHRLSTGAMEEVLASHKDVAECAVVGQADTRWGETVVAVVVLAPGAQLTPEQVQAHVGSRLAAYKVPQRVHVRTELLPRNPAGKMLKTTLKREYSAA